jgi:hypothetical protein
MISSGQDGDGMVMKELLRHRHRAEINFVFSGNINQFLLKMYFVLFLTYINQI